MGIIFNNHTMIDDGRCVDIRIVADRDTTDTRHMRVYSIVIPHPDIVADDGKVLEQIEITDNTISTDNCVWAYNVAYTHLHVRPDTSRGMDDVDKATALHLYLFYAALTRLAAN